MAGEGEKLLALTGSGEGERALAGSSKCERSPLRSLDYPCTACLRLRRLLTYHQRTRNKMRVIFDVRNLVRNIKFGQWRKASMSVVRFIGPDGRTYSYECNLLLGFIQDLMALNDFADGRTAIASLLANWFLSIYKNPALSAYPCFAALVADVLSSSLFVVLPQGVATTRMLRRRDSSRFVCSLGSSGGITVSRW
ncbi:unnamed protein product [Urochloa humidicola]